MIFSSHSKRKLNWVMGHINDRQKRIDKSGNRTISNKNEKAKVKRMDHG